MQEELRKISQALADVMEIKPIKAGVHIQTVDQKPDGLYFTDIEMLHSTLNNSALVHTSDLHVFIGLRELILDSPSINTISSVKEGKTCFIPADKFKSLFETTEWLPREISKILSYSTVQNATNGENERVNRLEKLVEVSRIVNSTLDLNKLLKIILDTALESVEGDRGTVYLLNEEKNELWSKVFDGAKSVTIKLPVGEGIAGHVALTGEVMNITNAQDDPRFNSDIDEKTGYTTKTILCMPLRNKDSKILGVFQLLNKKNGVFNDEDVQFIDNLSIQVSSALENARLYEQERKKIEMERDMLAASEVQRNLFPSEIPEIPGYKIAAINIPARTISGDLYDFVPLDENKLVFTLGDVSGKGLPAAILMANLQSILHDLPHQDPSPAYCAKRTNDIIHRVSSSGKFITLFLGLLDAEKNTVTFSNAGHEHPMLFRNGDTMRLGSGGLPIGIMENSHYDEEEHNVEPGDLILIFSDGVSDATNPAGKFFSEERLEKTVSNNLDLEPQELVDLLCNDVKSFTEEHPQFDDITMMVIRRVG